MYSFSRNVNHKKGFTCISKISASFRKMSVSLSYFLKRRLRRENQKAIGKGKSNDKEGKKES